MFSWFRRKRPSLYLDPSSAVPASATERVAPTRANAVRGNPDHLLAELATIGRDQGFLSSAGKKRTREIGAQLHRNGGMPKMLSTHRTITTQLGRIAGRELEAAWDGIGPWYG